MGGWGKERGAVDVSEEVNPDADKFNGERIVGDCFRAMDAGSNIEAATPNPSNCYPERRRYESRQPCKGAIRCLLSLLVPPQRFSK